MGRSIQAIVRYTIREPTLIDAGRCVLTSAVLDSIQNAPGRMPCWLEQDPDRILYIPSDALLPMKKFLVHWPIDDFWMLLHKGRLRAGHSEFLMQEPRKVRLGAVPHRFESEGECLHYLNHYELSPSVFLVAHVTKKERPLWFE